MTISKKTIDYNKEFVFGQIGTLVGTETFGFIGSKIFSSAGKISAFVVLGAAIFSVLFWIFTRLYDRMVKDKDSKKKVAKEVVYIAVASIFVTFAVSYPTIFFLTKYLLIRSYHVGIATVISQAIAFVLFMVCMNIYRKIIKKIRGIIL